MLVVVDWTIAVEGEEGRWGDPWSRSQTWPRLCIVSFVTELAGLYLKPECLLFNSIFIKWIKIFLCNKFYENHFHMKLKISYKQVVILPYDFFTQTVNQQRLVGKKKKLQNWFHKSNVDFLRKELVILLDGTISQNFCCGATLEKKRKKGKTFWAWLTWKWDDEGKFRHGISPTNSVKQVPTS